MKLRVLVLVLLCALWTGAAFAQFFPFPGPGRTGGGAASPTWTGTGAVANGSCGFAGSCNITTTATVSAGTFVGIIGAIFQGTATGTISASACGTSLTVDTSATATAGQYNAVMVHGTVAGGTCTITIAVSGGTVSIEAAAAGFGTLNNLVSGTPGTACQGFYNVSQNSPYPCTGGLTVGGSGFGIVGYLGNQATLPTSPGTIVVDATAQQGSGTNIVVGIGHVTTSCTAAQCEYAAANFSVANTIGEPFQ